jgi:hypothetical protein
VSSVWTLRAVPIAGGAVIDVEPVSNVTELFTLGPHVYYTVRNNNPLDRISRHSAAGGIELLAQGQLFDAVGADATNLYYTLYTGSAGNVSIYKMPLGGGPAIQVNALPFPGTSAIYSVESTHLYTATDPSGGGGTAWKVVK